MSSFNGLKKIAATDIQNSGRFYLGNGVNAGTAGQALVSGGPNEPARWDIHTGTIQPLTMGSNVSLASGNPDFDGSIPDTLNSVDTTYTAGNGIQISGSNIIQTKTDNQTIKDSGGGSGNQLEVIKVPNALTAGTNITFSSGTTYDGSAAITINASDTDTTYQAGNGIEIDPFTTPYSIVGNADATTITNTGGPGNKLSVLKVPNDLTFTGYATGTFNGSSALNINLVNTTYQAGNGIEIDPFTTPYSIVGNADATTITNTGGPGNKLSVLKVPNTLTCGANLAFITGTDYDGSAPRQIYLTKTPTGFNSITMSSTASATTITGNTYPGNPTHCSYLDLTSSTNVFPKFVGGSEILKSLSYIDNTSQNYNLISNTAFKFFFDGSQTFGTDTLEIDFTATSTTGYCEYGFFANSYTSGIVFMAGIAVATGGTSPFSTPLGSGAVSIDAYKLGLFDGTTTRYSLKEILDFDGYENTYITSQFYFNNLSIGTRYRMALYGRCWNTGSIYLNTGGKGTTGLPDRNAHQPAFMKFYEYDSSIGGARPGGGGGGGGGF